MPECGFIKPQLIFAQWTPYVAGANVDSKEQTFVKLGWNPIYIEPDVPFRNELPDWGVRIEVFQSNLPCVVRQY
jgi:hypothetical protein